MLLKKILRKVISPDQAEQVEMDPESRMHGKEAVIKSNNQEKNKEPRTQFIIINLNT